MRNGIQIQPLTQPLLFNQNRKKTFIVLVIQKKGAICVWDDNRNSLVSSTDIYAQRIKSNGIEKWATNGIAICTASGIQKSNNITSGGSDGSSIITWEDGRNGNYDIYAQKIDSSGNILWGVNGVIVCNALNNQKNPKIVSDASGGAIIVWEDSANFYFDILRPKNFFCGNSTMDYKWSLHL